VEGDEKQRSTQGRVQEQGQHIRATKSGRAEQAEWQHRHTAARFHKEKHAETDTCGEAGPDEQRPQRSATCSSGKEAISFSVSATICHKRGPLTLFLGENQDNGSP